MIHDLVARDDAEPTAEVILWAHLAESIDVFGNRLEDSLDNIGNVVVLEIIFLTPVVDKRG